jgi:hypothetical protein
MIERQVELAPDGSTFGDRVIVVYEGQDGRKITYDFDPDGLYTVIHEGIVRMSGGGATDNQQRKNLARLMKVAIKGMLIMYGNQILDELFLTKDHPKPQKGDDLIEWYQDIFTKVGIGYLMKSDTVLSGYTVDENERETIVKIVRVSTRPIPLPASVEGA